MQVSGFTLQQERKRRKKRERVSCVRYEAVTLLEKNNDGDKFLYVRPSIGNKRENTYLKICA